MRSMLQSALEVLSLSIKHHHTFAKQEGLVSASESSGAAPGSSSSPKHSLSRSLWKQEWAPRHPSFPSGAQEQASLMSVQQLRALQQPGCSDVGSGSLSSFFTLRGEFSAAKPNTDVFQSLWLERQASVVERVRRGCLKKDGWHRVNSSELLR